MGFSIVRMALCTLIHNYEFEAVDKLMQFLQPGFVVTDVNNFHFRVTRRVK